MQRCKGFTVLELVMVIVILLSVAAIAGINLHAYSLNRNLKAAAWDIESDFSACKQNAVSENRIYQIVFDVAGGSYTIQTTTGIPPAVTKKVTSFGSDIAIFAATFGPSQLSTVSFNNRGMVSPLGNPAPNIDGVILKNSRNSTATIQVNTMGRTYVKYVLK
jgi:prepilin-type N-terminal cleavage/methylation domain-containing protein